MMQPISCNEPGRGREDRDTLPSSRPPTLLRKFSSQYPRAAVGEEPTWGIRADYVGPCSTCGRPTRWVDCAHGAQHHFCSERCLDERLELEMQVLGPWPVVTRDL